MAALTKKKISAAGRPGALTLSKKMRCHPDSNWRIKVLQTFALPLGYGTEKNGAVDEARTRDLHLGKVALYQLSYYRKRDVPWGGIEPPTL